MKSIHVFLSALCLTGALSSCSKDSDKPIVPPEPDANKEIAYAGQFARDVLSDVYLWSKEIGGNLGQLSGSADPIATVKNIRYHNNGKEVDKWTTLTNDYASFTSSMMGIETTYGYNLLLGKFSNSGTYFFIISHVYRDSPAQKAGLKRGNIIMELNGKDITENNYMDVFNSSKITLGMGVLSGNNIQPGGNVSLTAIKMYEDPILANNVFDCNGKKVGYLAYSSFNMPSVPRLIEICKDFKAQGVTELILDLRYNGGGSVTTENALASMFAPASEVNAKGLYQTEIWNKKYTDYFKQQGRNTNTYFSTSFEIEDENEVVKTVSTQGANIGLTKIYGLISAHSASASESLLIGLMPFMDVELIGNENSHGKYCTGMVLSPSQLYKEDNGVDHTPQEIKNWGIYVMINRYADKNGNNPCMPDGLTPTVEASDNPMESYQLGDEREAMLSVALARAGKPGLTRTRSVVTLPKYDTKMVSNNPLFGLRIDDRLDRKK